MVEEWTEGPREQLRSLRQRLLPELGPSYQAGGQPERAVEALRTLLREEPLEEEAHRSLTSLAQNRLQAGDLRGAAAYIEESFQVQGEVGECITCDGLLYPVAVPIFLATDDLEQRARRLYRRLGADPDPDRLSLSLA